MLDLVSRSVTATEDIATALAHRLHPGDVVFVRGEIGSGKTTVVRAACCALGVTGRVTSPTFTIGHRYEGRRGPISHLDLYRFEGLSDAEWGDLEPYFDGSTVFVEWPDVGRRLAAGPLGRGLARAPRRRRRAGSASRRQAPRCYKG